MMNNPTPRMFLTLLAAMVICLCVFFLGAPMQRLVSVIPDDAAYYFKIAENVGAGRGLTFDGINRTNGFQPLWLSVLVPVYAAYHGTPETMFRIFLVVQLVILAAASLLLRALLARYFSQHAVFMSLCIYLFFVLIPAANGLESAILVFSLALLFYFAGKAEIFGRHSTKREFVFGILLGLVVMSRLDMIFVPAVVLAVCLVRMVTRRANGREEMARFLGIFAGAAVIVAPYLVYNLVSFGDVMPISGALKSSFPHLANSRNAVSSMGKRGWAGILFAFGYLAWFIASYGELRKNLSGRLFFQACMAVMAGAALLHFLHTICFMKWAVFKWHFIPYALLGSVAACEPVQAFLSARGTKLREAIYWFAVAALIFVGCLGMIRNFTQRLDGNWNVAAYDAALWARRDTSADAVFAMKDAGNFGYFSERAVINLDGVVNNLEYQRALKERRLSRYLEQNGVRYLVQHAFWRRPDILSGSYESYSMSYRSRRYEMESDEIRVYRDDEVYRSRPYYDGPYETAFIIWKLREL